MKNLLKKMLVAVLVGITAVSATVVATSCKKKTDITVGILQVGDHDALNKSRQGFIDTLNKWAKSKNKTVKFDAKNALGDGANESTYARTLVASKPDLLLGIATSSAI